MIKCLGYQITLSKESREWLSEMVISANICCKETTSNDQNGADAYSANFMCYHNECAGT